MASKRMSLMMKWYEEAARAKLKKFGR